MSLGTPSIPLNRKITERTANGAWAAGVLKNEEIGPESKATVAARTTPMMALAVIAEDTWRRVDHLAADEGGSEADPAEEVTQADRQGADRHDAEHVRLEQPGEGDRDQHAGDLLDELVEQPPAHAGGDAGCERRGLGGERGVLHVPVEHGHRGLRATRNQSKTPVIAVVEPSCDVRTPARPCGENHWKMFAGVKAVPERE